jgi:hypothetical protein
MDLTKTLKELAVAEFGRLQRRVREGAEAATMVSPEVKCFIACTLTEYGKDTLTAYVVKEFGKMAEAGIYHRRFSLSAVSMLEDVIQTGVEEYIEEMFDVFPLLQ